MVSVSNPNRNQFETKTSSGSTDLRARSSWETRLFNGIYDAASPNERVKYGVLNIYADPEGVAACKQYGDSYLLLKHHVRFRCSFASKDSAYEGIIPSTVEYYAHVLADFTDDELREVKRKATGEVELANSSKLSYYKECQIHGPVRLSEDIEALVIPSAHSGNNEIRTNAETFATQNRCNLIWI